MFTFGGLTKGLSVVGGLGHLLVRCLQRSYPEYDSMSHLVKSHCSIISFGKVVRYPKPKRHEFRRLHDEATWAGDENKRIF